MTHDQMMQKAWWFIHETGITDDPDKFAEDNNLYLVEDIYQVRDAYYADLESGCDFGDEDVCDFFNRHGIKFS